MISSKTHSSSANLPPQNYPIRDSLQKAANEISNDVIPLVGLSLPFFGSTLAAGTLAGVALNKVGLDNPKAITKQIQMKTFLPVKTYLSALGVGCLGLSLYSLQNDVAIFPTRPTNLLLSAIGGGMAGVGVSMSGSTPNTLFAQLGSLRPESLWILLGSLVGSFSFSSLSHFGPFREWFIENFSFLTLRNSTLPGFLNVRYHSVAIPFTLLIGSSLYLLEGLYPTEMELESSKVVGVSTTSSLKASKGFSSSEERSSTATTLNFSVKEWFSNSKWNPYLAGAIYGLTLLPSYFLGRQFFLESTYSYSSVIDRVSNFFFNKAPHLHETRIVNEASWIQLLFDAGILMGSFLATKYLTNKAKVMLLEDERKHKQLSTSTKLSLALGGFLMLFGFKMAGTSDMSPVKLSIGSFLSLSSCVATAMFFSKK